ncbi:MAG TPA: saccharopine dehydrogenase, partial [Actinomycetes bacterium]|nr:saccharopine dehydrogenase [Actinomycetes bacterium]
PDEATRRAGRSQVVAVAADDQGREQARVDLQGPDPYTLTARLLAWAATRAASHGLEGTGALGPVDAFGLDTLQAGAATAGLERTEPR